jgi:hypothetical protein
MDASVIPVGALTASSIAEALAVGQEPIEIRPDENAAAQAARCRLLN